jgi:hypothetical protein
VQSTGCNLLITPSVVACKQIYVRALRSLTGTWKLASLNLRS